MGMAYRQENFSVMFQAFIVSLWCFSLWGIAIGLEMAIDTYGSYVVARQFMGGILVRR